MTAPVQKVQKSKTAVSKKKLVAKVVVKPVVKVVSKPDVVKVVSKPDVDKVVTEKVVDKVVSKPDVDKVVTEKVVKSPKVVKPSVIRKVNSKPVLAKTTGINISPAKVKNIVSNFVLNRDAHLALKELKDATPRQITKSTDGKETAEDFKGTPVAELSQETRDYIKHANECYEKNLRSEFVKKKVSNLSTEDREKYVKARTVSKSMSDDETFDLEAFNKTHDSGFYNQYEIERKARDTDTSVTEWKRSIDQVTKLKTRFSTNSRVHLSALVEYLIKQLASNGTVCCVADKKKIIQLNHILDTTKDGFEERFPLHPLIINLDTFKQATQHFKDLDLEEKSKSKKVLIAVPNPEDGGGETVNLSVESSTTPEPVDKSKNIDIFTLENLSLDKQYQFRYYIGESCREVRMDLATDKTDEGNVYNFTSVSKLFKNFCSTLVCEFLIRIGKMLETEIRTRGIKTVNDTIIKTVISQYHIVCGVSEDKTNEFITAATKKYYEYVDQRQKKRKESKKTGDLTYTSK
jgi:hypothetical protein